ncbi:MAG: MgtC/SapB family protein [Treponema sp.]|nr:MgtC/SapB family protein [Treponema sp.]
MEEFLSSHFYIEIILRLLASLFCGLLLGLERKIRKHTVGIRTLVLISLSSCLLSIISVYMANLGPGNGDPTRIAASIAAGIGFIGAGAIIKQGLNIRGLTSAAIIFTAAAIGTTCGTGLYIAAAATLLLAMFTLPIMGKLEKKFFPAEKRKLVKISFKNSNINQEEIRKILESNGLIIFDLDVYHIVESGKTDLTYTVKAPDALNPIKVSKDLSECSGVENVSISKD